MDMKSVPSKRALRLEKRKKKMAALVDIVRLNDQDKKPEQVMTKRLSSENVSDVTSEKKPKLDGDSYVRIKKEMRDRNNRLRIQPKLWLREIGVAATVNVDIDNRTPLFVSDIQHLVLFSRIGHHSPYTPSRWCQLDKFNRLRSTYVLIVDDVSLYDFVSNESSFPFLSSKFEVKLEVLNPAGYKGHLVHDFMMVPLTSIQIQTYLNQYGSLKEACEQDEVFDLLKGVFPITADEEQENDSKEQRENQEDSTKNLPDTDKFSRTHLLLSGWQMVEENFPMPIVGLMERKYSGYVMTKDRYEPVTASSPMFGLDCEMCMTTARELELTRVSLVDERHDVFYESLVKPENKIVDYLTKYSGITPQMMADVTKRLGDVQDDLRRLLPPDAILIGQSVNGDFHAMKIFHPYVIDTSIIYNLTGERARKSKLKLLAKQFLNESIQASSKGHCSVEDSLASLKLVQHKLTESLYYGDAVMSKVKGDVVKYPDLGRSNYATSLLKQTTKMDKRAAVFATEPTLRAYKRYTLKGETVGDGTENVKNVRFVVGRRARDVVREMRESEGCSLNIGHVRWKKQGAEGYAALDRHIGALFEAREGPNLHIVLFAGRKEPNVANGCCFIAVKKLS